MGIDCLRCEDISFFLIFLSFVIWHSRATRFISDSCLRACLQSQVNLDNGMTSEPVELPGYLLGYRCLHFECFFEGIFGYKILRQSFQLEIWLHQPSRPSGSISKRYQRFLPQVLHVSSRNVNVIYNHLKVLSEVLPGWHDICGFQVCIFICPKPVFMFAVWWILIALIAASFVTHMTKCIRFRITSCVAVEHVGIAPVIFRQASHCNFCALTCADIYCIFGHYTKEAYVIMFLKTVWHFL